MALVWTTIAPAIPSGRFGHLERKTQRDTAIKLHNGQAVKIEGGSTPSPSQAAGHPVLDRCRPLPAEAHHAFDSAEDRERVVDADALVVITTRS
jgi:hypothetical protein